MEQSIITLYLKDQIENFGYSKTKVVIQIKIDNYKKEYQNKRCINAFNNIIIYEQCLELMDDDLTFRYYRDKENK